MKYRGILLAGVALLAVSAGPAAAASHVFTTPDDPLDPGAIGGTSIDQAGQVVGASSVFAIHGFLENGGVYTNPDVPGSAPASTGASGINDTGQIVGGFLDASNQAIGFMLSGGDDPVLDDPAAGTGGTAASGINAVGTSNRRHDDVDSGGAFTTVDVSGASLDGSFNALASVESRGKYAALDDPLGYVGLTYASGTNDLGQVAGGFQDGGHPGFVVTGTAARGSTPNSRLSPSPCSGSCGQPGFDNPAAGSWFDLPTASGFNDELAGGGAFTGVGALPAYSGFGPVDVIVNGAVVGVFEPDGSYAFGPAISQFFRKRTPPAVDGVNPKPFPTFLDFAGPPRRLFMAPPSTAVPEPGSWGLVVTGLAGLGSALRTRRRRFGQPALVR